MFYLLFRGWVCDSWKHRFLPHLIFNWRTFSRRVTALWSRDGQKIKFQPIKTREISGVRLQEELYVYERIKLWQFSMDSFTVLLSMWIKLYLRKINNFSSGMRVFTACAGQSKLYQNENDRRRGWIEPRGSRV